MPRQRTSRELAVALGVLGVLLVPATVIGLGVEGFLVRFYEHWSRHWLALLFVSLLSSAVTCWIPCLFAFERTRFGNRLDLGVVILLGGGGGFAIPLLFGVDHLGYPLTIWFVLTTVVTQTMVIDAVAKLAEEADGR